MLPASSPAIRIHQGETIVCQAWSNTATSLWGFFRILYDNGTEDEFVLPRTLLLNNRVQGQLVCKRVAREDGYVIQGQICQVAGISGQANQRGQCYVRAAVASESAAAETGSISSCKAMLLSGYVYAGFEPCLGEFIEPGPAGGSGAITETATADPAAGAEIATQTVPGGAIWRLRVFSVQLVQGITQTPLPTLRMRGANGVIVQIPITTTAIGASSTCQLTWGRGLVQSSFVAVVGDEFHT